MLKENVDKTVSSRITFLEEQIERNDVSEDVLQNYKAYLREAKMWKIIVEEARQQERERISEMIQDRVDYLYKDYSEDNANAKICALESIQSQLGGSDE